jgi:very-short-patch-repair endonuclease
MLTKIENREMRGSHRYALYKCVCGVEKVLRVSAVNSGTTKSCGCHRKKVVAENGKKSRTTHGKTNTKLYSLWMCKVKTNSIWKSFNEFYNWAEDKYQNGLTIYTTKDFYDNEAVFISSMLAKELSRIKTCLKKYGTTNVLSDKNVQNKIKETNIKKYGTTNPATLDFVKQKTINNNRKKYGVDYPQQLPDNKLKSKKAAIEKVGFDTEEWSKKIGVSRSCFLNRVRKYGFDKAITIGKYQTDIESVIENILQSNNIKYQHSTKLDKYYPDFILPDYNIIIEADGLYWHSDAVNKNNNYHKEKMFCYESLGYRTLFFRENEINNQTDIVASIIKNSCKMSNKIYARQCKIVELDKQERKMFFNSNHLMGVGSGRCYGLSFGNNIVSALQFTIKNNVVDISRFCNVLNTSVTGGYSKLINSVIINHKDVNKIQTFVDRRYGVGSYLISMGFELLTNRLSFVWIKNEKTYHRMKYRGNSGYEYGMYKLWDCGQYKFEKKINPA